MFIDFSSTFIPQPEAVSIKPLSLSLSLQVDFGHYASATSVLLITLPSASAY